MYDFIVIGSGVAGYSAAFLAAQEGQKVLLIEKKSLGGTCLNLGCIPTKYHLEIVHRLRQVEKFRSSGLVDNLQYRLNLDSLRDHSQKLRSQLRNGLQNLMKKRSIEWCSGVARFKGPKSLLVRENSNQIEKEFLFRKALIATGSNNRGHLAAASTKKTERFFVNEEDAINLAIQETDILFIGAGVLGIELATIYSFLGYKVTIIEQNQRILSNFSRKAGEIILNKLRLWGIKVHLSTTINQIKEGSTNCLIEAITGEKKFEFRTERIVITSGRYPATAELELENAGIKSDSAGYIEVNDFLQTSNKNVFAAGDIINRTNKLAHLGSYQGKVVARNLKNKKTHGLETGLIIPRVCYSDPEISAIGDSLEEAKKKGIDAQQETFPWLANGKAHILNEERGEILIVWEKKEGRILGAEMIGNGSSELIGEIGVLIRQNMTIKEISKIIHPHPGLAESISQAAQKASHICTDI